MGRWLNLVVGGIAGTVSRYLLTGFIYELLGTSFPYGTLVVNLVGCLVIGFLASLSEEKFLLSPEARLLLMVGFCGAFTTFSTFMLETCNLMKVGENLRAFFNVAASVIFGFLAFRLGVFLAEIF